MADLKEEVVGTVDDPVELASLIDKLMAEGNGHVNIEAKETECHSHYCQQHRMLRQKRCLLSAD